MRQKKHTLQCVKHNPSPDTQFWSCFNTVITFIEAAFSVSEGNTQHAIAASCFGQFQRKHTAVGIKKKTTDL